MHIFFNKDTLYANFTNAKNMLKLMRFSNDNVSHKYFSLFKATKYSEITYTNMKINLAVTAF